MPTILTISGIKFIIRTNDHGAPHVHVIKNECEAKIYIEDGTVDKYAGFSKRDLLRLSKIITERKQLFLEAYNEYHKKEK